MRRYNTIDSLTSRNNELDARARELMEAKYKLDSKVSDLSSRFGVADAELKVTKEELKNLRKVNKDLDKARIPSALQSSPFPSSSLAFHSPARDVLVQ